MQREAAARIPIIAIALLALLLLSGPAHADVYINSRTGNIDFNTNSVHRMRLSSDGNLTIGGTLNGGRVLVLGDLNVANTATSTPLLFVSAGKGRVGINTYSPANTLNIVGDLNIQNYNASGFALRIDSNSLASPVTGLLVDRNGNVGIATVAPQNRLNLLGDLNVVAAAGTGAPYLFVRGTDGNVGLGTASPQSRLHVIGDLNVSGRIYLGGGSLGWVTSGNAIYYNVASADGNVGIGLTAPQALLDVNGSILQRVPTTLTIKGSVQDNTNLNQPRGVFVSGRYAYVANNVGTSLAVVDISNPASPAVVGSVIDATALNGAMGIFVSGNYAYVTGGTGVDRLTVVDVSNPASPRVVSSLNDATNLTTSRGIFVSGRYAYVAAQNANALTIVDISNPNSISVAGRVVDATNLLSVFDVFVSGRYAYLVSSNNLAVVDVSNPSAPAVVGNLADSTNLSGAISVFVSGRYAYVAAGGGNRITVVDVNNPIGSGLRVAGTVQDNTALRGARSVFVSGKYAYVTGTDSNRFTVVDVSNPASPVVAAALNSASDFNSTGVKSVFVSGRYAYVGSDTQNKLTIVDLQGSDLPSVSVGSVSAGSLQVADLLDVGSHANVRGGLNVGPGGIYSQGKLSVVDTNGSDLNSSIVSVIDMNSVKAGATTSVFSVFKDANVGIGTLSPRNKLTILGDLNVTPAGTGAPALFVRYGDGNVGIGTTTPKNALNVIGDLNVTGTSYIGTFTGLINTASNAIFRGDLNAYGGLNANTVRSFDNNALSIQTRNTARITIAAADGNVSIGNSLGTSRLTITGDLNVANTITSTPTLFVSAGNNRVGIGTYSPANLLNVIGDLNVYNSSNAGAMFEVESGYTELRLKSGGASGQWNIGTGWSGIDVNSLYIQREGITDPKMVITRDGNVGIGTTSPTGLLHLNNDTNTLTLSVIIDGNRSNDATISQLVFQNNADDVASVLVRRAGANDAGELSFGTQATGGALTERFVITPAGNAIFRKDLNALGGINANTIRSFDNNTLSLQTLNTARMTIATDGNVGINTAAPSARLQVFGASGDTNLLSVNMSTGVPAIVALAGDGNVGLGVGLPNYRLEIYEGELGISDSDVTHGITSDTQTDTIFRIMGLHTSNGGALVKGFSTNNADSQPFVLLGAFGSQDPTDTVPAIQLRSARRSSTALADLASTETAFQVSDSTGADDFLTILGDGNVGIGDSTPSATFQVGTTPTLAVNPAQGRVGILTATPTSTLSFSGSDAQISMNTADGADSSILQIGGGGVIGTTRGAYINLTGNEYSTPTLDLFAGDNASGDIRMFTAGTNQRVTIKYDGNVGIGTTTPGAVFSVSKATQSSQLATSLAGAGVNIVAATYTNGQFWPGLYWSVGNDNATKPRIGIWGQMTNSGDFMYFGTNNNSASGITNTAMAIGPDGNVGIGTTSPYGFLQAGAGDDDSAVAGDLITGYFTRGGSTTVSVRDSTNNVEIFTQADSGGGTLGTITNHSLALATNNTDRVTIATDGNVGIGTTTPAAELQIGSDTHAMKFDYVASDYSAISVNTADASDNRRLFIGGGGGQSWTRGAEIGLYGNEYTDSNGLLDLRGGSASGNVVITTNGGYIALAGSVGEKIRMTDGGSVGIGDPTPDALLDVNGINSNADVLRVDANGNVNPVAFIIDKNGNVGIGTTTPNTLVEITSISTDGAILLLNGNNAVQGNRAALFMAPRNANGNLGNVSIEGISVNNQQAEMAFRTGGTTITAFGTERMRITTDGNVGVGTTTPTRTFQVGTTPAFAVNTASGKVNIGTTNTDYNVNVNSGYTGGLQVSNFADSTIILTTNAAQSPMLTSGGSAQSLLFGINSVEKMRIASDGNVGIGDTTPSGLLDVDTSAGADTLVINSQSGNIGIGTVAPLQPLHIYKNSDVDIQPILLTHKSISNGFPREVSIGFGVLQSADANSAVTAKIAAIRRALGDAPTDLVFSTYDDAISPSGLNERMRVTSRGSVGIGDPSPDALLDVNGINLNSDVLRVDASGNLVPISFVIDKNGNVGVRTASPASGVAMDVNQGAKAVGLRVDGGPGSVVSPTIQLRRSDGTAGTGNIDWIDSEGQVDWRIGVNNNVGGSFAIERGTSDANTYFLIDSAGDIGIGGDTTPDANLEVGGTFMVTSTASATDGDRLTVLSDGNVGIGTATPAYKLVVNGYMDWNASNMNPTNLLANGGVENWAGGASAVAPSAWIFTDGVGGGSSDRNSVITKIGSYSASISRPAGAGTVQLTQVNTTDTNILGNTYTLSAWVFATTANRAVLQLSDGVTTTTSAYHSGGGIWELLSVTKTFASNAGTLEVALQMNNGVGTGTFDGVTLVEGPVPFSFRERPVEPSKDGNVGIGTTTPRNKLNVIGDLNVLTSATATPSLYVNNTDGNVGIGTTAPERPLHIERTGGVAGSAGDGMVLLEGAHNTSNRPYIYFKNNTAGTTFTGGLRWINGDGTTGWGFENNNTTATNYLEFNNAGTNMGGITPDGNFWLGGTAGTNTRNRLVVVGDLNVVTSLTATSSLYVNSTDGNVGIGTTTPDFKLDIEQDFAATNTVANLLRLTRTTSGTADDGIGAGIDFYAEDDGGNIRQVGVISGVLEDTAASSLKGGLRFSSRNATNAITLANDGNVGIGDTTPDNTFQVGTDGALAVNDAGNRVGIGDVTPDDVLDIESSVTSGVGIRLNSTDTGGREFSFKSTATGNGVGAGKLSIGDETAGATRMLISSDGNVGIGTTTPDVKLQLDGNFLPEQDAVWNIGSPSLRWNTLYASNGTIQTSDARLKENIENVPLGLGFIRNLRPVAYTWKPGQGGEGIRYGFLAQQVEAASGNRPAPGVYYDLGSDRYGLNYSELLAPTVKAVQELDASQQGLSATVLAQWKVIDGQQKTIEEQANKIKELEGKLAAEKERNDLQDARLKAIEDKLAKNG